MQFQDVHSGYPLKGEGVKVTSCPVTSELLVRPGQQINLRWSGWSSLTGHKWGTLSGHRGITSLRVQLHFLLPPPHLWAHHEDSDGERVNAGLRVLGPTTKEAI